jgi:hypothetical protein
MSRRAEWSWGDATDTTEVRIMALPDRKASYLVMHTDDGMHQIARFLDDRAAEEFAAWLDTRLGEGA